jgi:hypothetical protein
MTRARALKQVIRARAARTGERYTTARRHVLASLKPSPRAARSESASPAPTPDKPAAAARHSRGTVSDDRVREKTGRDLDHWFAVLDTFGAVQKGHTETARHLSDAHGVDAWYSQAITVAYERARGVRAVNQRSDGAFAVSASKVVKAGAAAVVKALTTARLRRQWLAATDASLARPLSKALADAGAKSVIVKPNGEARLRLKFDGTIAQVFVVPKPGGKVTVTVDHGKLPGAGAVEELRSRWRGSLAALAELVE